MSRESHRWRKKPVEVEAYHWISEPAARADFDRPRWLTEATRKVPKEPGAIYLSIADDNAVYIRTLEGAHVVSDGDWIVRGVAGELYPVRPDIFAATYEKVVA